MSCKRGEWKLISIRQIMIHPFVNFWVVCGVPFPFNKKTSWRYISLNEVEVTKLGQPNEKRETDTGNRAIQPAVTTFMAACIIFLISTTWHLASSAIRLKIWTAQQFELVPHFACSVYKTLQSRICAQILPESTLISFHDCSY